ncbi:MAG: heparinase II/III family protein, partial [Rikenellaceae bacterium]
MKRILIIIIAALCLSCNKNVIAETKVTVLDKELPSHPRLLFTSADQKRVEELINADPLAKRLKYSLAAEANKILTLPQINYDNNATDILMTSREYVYRLFTLSMAHRLADDKKYIGHIEQTLLHLCSNYPTWHPAHYLDVAEMTTAVAVAYDWTYNYLSASTREIVKNAIKRNALDLAIKEYKNGGSGSWAKRETNWNVVCNAGMTMGALAVAEDYPEIAGEVVTNAAKYTPNCLKYFAPDGTCYEGPAYWEYTDIYLSMLMKSLDDNFNDCFGIDKLDGVSKSALFYLETASPEGCTFNFADSSPSKIHASPVYFYFSRKFNQPSVATVARQLLTKTLDDQKLPRWHFYLSLAWFDSSVGSALDYKPMQIFRGINDIIVLKGDPKNAKSIFLSAKGGAPDLAHQQLDVGSFVLEREGVRWFDDLGSESYSLDGFWDYAPTGKRWNYFLNTNFSHNTIFIDSKLQFSKGRGKLTSTDVVTSSATIDMSSVYPTQATLVERTFAMPAADQIVVT